MDAWHHSYIIMHNMALAEYIYIIIFLGILGAVMGSFATMLLYRIHSPTENSILGRSACPSCKHTLSILDLFPIVSYLLLRWKCRYCSIHIPSRYVWVEISMSISFMIFGGAVFPMFFSHISSEFVAIWGFLLYLWCVFVVVFVTFYDGLFREIPDGIVIPTLAILLIAIGADMHPAWSIFPYHEPTMHTLLADTCIAAGVIYGFFIIQMLIPACIYSIQKRSIRPFLSTCVWSLTFPLWVFLRFFLSEKRLETWKLFSQTDQYEDMPQWIGGWDLRLALFIGLFGGIKIGLLGLLLAYILWSIAGICIRLLGNKDRYIAFWPFLGYGVLIASISYIPITNWYLYHFIYI